MDKKKIFIKTDNLAVPEVIVDKDETGFDDDQNVEKAIEYDNLAIPEIKVFNKKES